MTEVLTLTSPAKINLYLRVLNKRPDGYHDIETVFERIDLYDTIKLRPLNKDIVVLCDNPQVPCDSRNLVYRAAAALKGSYDVTSGVEITLNKKIPVAAGLGGASSDCAACLRGLNELWGLRLKKDAVFDIGSRIGADVGFFLMDTGRAIGRGKGEILEPLPKGETFWYLLVNPGFEALAKDAYSALNFGLTHTGNNSKIDMHSLRKIQFKNLKGFLFNSLEAPVEKKYKEVSEAKSEIAKAGLKLSLMSGSGPTVYGVASSREEALEVKKRLLIKEGWQAFVAATLW